MLSTVFTCATRPEPGYEMNSGLPSGTFPNLIPRANWSASAPRLSTIPDGGGLLGKTNGNVYGNKR